MDDFLFNLPEQCLQVAKGLTSSTFLRGFSSTLKGCWGLAFSDLRDFFCSASLSESESESLLLSELELAESLSLPSEPRLRSRVVRPLAGGALVTVFSGNRRSSLLL